ncbi:RNB-domain-containing protein [Macrolepiota fuliginosa MF-IS2]|uniref:RNB-domain-containing protein n=1 Tax=Macrolepiota fuliginosa MF-IS2 TaxID=1400762 RepID=A0A9P5XEH3_9AGAR|nr:RNB-domain-containing protein [Macrolepiota fuliginosa MF-IS2]
MPSQRGDEMRLRQKVQESARKAQVAIPLVRSGALESPSQQVFNEPILADQVEQDECAVYTPETPLGSFVEMRRNDLLQEGIVIGSGFMDRQWKLAVITKDGEQWLPLKDDVFFSIPSIISSDLATRCGIQPVPETPTQLNARVEVLKRFRKVEREVENAMVDLSRKLVSVYEAVRAKDPDAWAEVTVSEIAKMFYKNPTAIEIFATHKLLMNNSARFVAAAAYQANQILRIRPLNHVKDLNQVQEWVRGRDPVVKEFLTKAKKVAKVQKTLTESSVKEGPSSEPAKHSWTEADKTIIRFLVASLRHGRSIQPDPYTVSLGSILKGFYGLSDIIHIDDVVQKLLVDIGVFTPWQDLIIIEPSNKLDLETRPAVLKEREEGIIRALVNSKNPVPIHPDDFYATDPMESVRHDWGNMPVYVIDDACAEELDDGISIEQIPSEPGNTWVHIHVADPASLIPPTNALAQKASRQFESWYMLPKSFPLFPSALTHHPTHGLSLGIRSRNGSPDRVMTFSAKVDSAGNILDQQVRAGLIRNVQILNYDAVDAALALPTAEVEYPFGNGVERGTFNPLAPEVLKDLRIFKEIADAQRRQRLARNWFSFDRKNGYVERVNEMPTDVGAQIDTPLHHRGFPNLRYKVDELCLQAEYGSRAIIAEMMKLSCRAASRWCLGKNIPVLRRSSDPMVPVSEEAIDKLLNVRDEVGYVPEAGFLDLIMFAPSARYTLLPEKHFGLGVPEGEGYVRVTSPLRRYGDIVVHWQIQHALLAEKGLSLPGKVGSGPRFSSEWMEEFGGAMALADQHIKGTGRRHKRYWALSYIKRWQELFANGRNRELWPKDAEGRPIEDPLENLNGYVVTMPVINKLTHAMQVQVVLPRLGLKEIVGNVPSHVSTSAHVGTYLPVKVKDINLGVKPVMTLEYDKSQVR